MKKNTKTILCFECKNFNHCLCRCKDINAKECWLFESKSNGTGNTTAHNGT